MTSLLPKCYAFPNYLHRLSRSPYQVSWEHSTSRVRQAGNTRPIPTGKKTRYSISPSTNLWVKTVTEGKKYATSATVSFRGIGTKLKDFERKCFAHTNTIVKEMKAALSDVQKQIAEVLSRCVYMHSHFHELTSLVSFHKVVSQQRSSFISAAHFMVLQGSAFSRLSKKIEGYPNDGRTTGGAFLYPMVIKSIDFLFLF